MLHFNGRKTWKLTDGASTFFFIVDNDFLYCWLSDFMVPDSAKKGQVQIRTPEPYRELVKDIFEMELIINQ